MRVQSFRSAFEVDVCVCELGCSCLVSCSIQVVTVKTVTLIVMLQSFYALLVGLRSDVKYEGVCLVSFVFLSISSMKLLLSVVTLRGAM